MAGYFSHRKSAVTAAVLAAGGVLLYYLLRRKRDNRRQDIADPESVYNVVKDLCKQYLVESAVVLVESTDDWNRAYSLLSKDLVHLKVLGMDSEWVTEGRKRKPVSMLQLSTLNCTALVRIHLLQSDIPESLTKLMEDKSILKVGVGSLEDRDKILSDYVISMAGCVDLRYMAGRHRKSWSGGGLKTYAEQIAGMKLDKSNKLRCGDWEQQQLPEAMMIYAAGDSQAGLSIFMCLVALKLQNTSCAASTDELLQALQNRALPMCHGIVDLRYKTNASGADKPSASRSTQNNQVTARTPSKGISTNALRSKVMYSNCVMQAPDGQVLCVCDVKKAQWYCDRDKAEIVSEEGADEMVIRLKFEPSGRPATEMDYYRARKENICVVCGADKKFIRKNIIPKEYRRHFPQELKSHSSHDVVLLCSTCHQKSGVYDQQYKKHFAELCNAPYKSGGVTVDKEIQKVKSAARALNGYADRIPTEKREECESILRQFYETEELTDELLESAIRLDERNNESHDHGRVVVQYYMNNSSIQEFQKLWRIRFVEVMKPQHLGDYWRVDYNHQDYLWEKGGAEDASF